jgi:hypothetical protein
MRFFIDMCHRIASLFLCVTVLLVNLWYYLRYHTLCMLQFYFLHICGHIYCSTSLACIVFCFTSRDNRKVVSVCHFTVVVYLIVVKVTFCSLLVCTRLPIIYGYFFYITSSGMCFFALPPSYSNFAFEGVFSIKKKCIYIFLW